MIAYIVIILFFFSIFLFFSLLRLYDLNQELKALQKQKLDYQFKQCYNRGILKGLRDLEKIWIKCYRYE